MRRFSYLVSRYVFQAILPYFVFTWLLLSVILFVQQAGRYSDLLLSTAIPNYLAWQLTIALIPNVIAFTCPIAALVGVIIGLSRMQGDSEMVALRAAGVGNLQISLSVVLIGILLSLFAFLVNLKGVPIASQIVRRVALQAALHKLESPVEPGIFNTELAGFTIFVRNGNVGKGVWENIFIYQEDKDNRQARLITAKEGRIDSKDDDSEIVLNQASVTTFDGGKGKKIATESVEALRLPVKTKRGDIVEKLSTTNRTPEEMGLTELARHSRTLIGTERTDVEILWQRRILLSITPLLFALLGAALVSKFNRGGRGFGILLALVSLVIYYLLALLGEQLARTGAISVLVSGLIPFISCNVAIVWLFISQRLFITRSISFSEIFSRATPMQPAANKVSPKNTYIDLTTGILDLDLVLSLIKNYLITVAFLTSIFIVFTAFELWKFAGTIDNGVTLLISYLFYLLPYIYIQIAPSALMVATLATYIIKSRQNEIVTWTAAGLSIYRLLLPCFLLMIVVGAINFGIQEWALTSANRKQDALRDQIRSRNKAVNDDGINWVANENFIYSFKHPYASDNGNTIVTALSIFEFSVSSSNIESLIQVDKARWKQNEIEFLTPSREFRWEQGKAVLHHNAASGIPAVRNPFDRTITKPSHLDLRETYYRAETSDSADELRTYLISLYKKYATPFLPFIITLFTAPFALSLSRKGNVLTLGYAVAIWLLFMGAGSVFEQLGTSGYLSPLLAVWGPLGIFTILGIYLLTRIRT